MALKVFLEVGRGERLAGFHIPVAHLVKQGFLSEEIRNICPLKNVRLCQLMRTARVFITRNLGKIELSFVLLTFQGKNIGQA